MNEGFETLKRAWLYVRSNSFLWPLAFVIAVAGGGATSFSLWVQSPIPRGVTGLSPVHRIGESITSFAGGNPAFWALFIIAGFMVGVVFLAAGAFAQVAAIGSVSEIERGVPLTMRDAVDWGRKHFLRFFALVVCYLLVLLLFAGPSYLFWWTLGRKGTVMPCLGSLIFGVGLAIVVAIVSVVFEMAARYLVLRNNGVFESVQLAVVLLREAWRDVFTAWFYVLAISIAGTITSAIVVALLSTPLGPLFAAADRNHNPLLIAVAICAFLAAWAIASAAAGLFSIMSSAIWTLTFTELD